MNTIAIITPNSKELEIYLRGSMDVDTICFDDVYRLEERLKVSPLRVDTLLIRDDGLKDNKYGTLKLNQAGDLLLNLLQRPLFEVDRIVYLNQTENTEHRELMEFIQSSKRIKTEVLISTQDAFQALMIKQLLIKSSVDFDDLNLTYRHVIKRKRGKMGNRSKYLAGFETDKAVVLEYNSFNPDINNDKKQLKRAVGTTKIQPTMDEVETLEELDLEVLTVEEKIETHKTVVVGVMGESKSGATTTSMILGASGSVYHKTLIIDMNYDNLGLSYVVEKTLFDEEVNNIKMSDLIRTGQGANTLREEMYDKNRLHILTLDMPAKGMVSKEEYGFFIANILNLVKNNYAYIIIDMPIEDLETYTGVVSKLDDIILCTPPYMNNIISMLTKVQESPILSMPIYDRISGIELDRIKCLRTRVFSTVNAGIKPITKEVFDRYSKAMIERTMKVTGIYSYTAKNYIDTVLFQQLLMGEER